MILKEPQKFKEVWQVVVDGIAENGRSPIIQEICDLTGIRSTNTVSYQLSSLVEAGYLEEIPSHNGRQVAGYTLPSAVHIVNGKQAFQNLFGLICSSPFVDQDDVMRMTNPDGSINYAQVLDYAWVVIREGIESYAG